MRVHYTVPHTENNRSPEQYATPCFSEDFSESKTDQNYLKKNTKFNLFSFCVLNFSIPRREQMQLTGNQTPKEKGAAPSKDGKFIFQHRGEI